MKILAHRGWWDTAGQKNTVGAFRRAFENGFGVETDVRDQDGVLRISHDMPTGPGLLSFADFLDIYREYPNAGTIALNIKADGLQAAIRAHLDAAGVTNLFCFDMAVPDSLLYLNRGFITYTRHSEFEPTPPYYAEAHGVWLDAFSNDWFAADVIRRHLDAGKAVALVSPELHGRDYRRVWDDWAGLEGENLSICTDLPHLAAQHWR